MTLALVCGRLFNFDYVVMMDLSDDTITIHTSKPFPGVDQLGNQFQGMGRADLKMSSADAAKKEYQRVITSLQVSGKVPIV